MIFTCNFANWKKIPLPTTPISIARHPPRNWDGLEYHDLFPPKELLYLYKNGLVDEKKYAEFYKKQVLDVLSPADVVNSLYDNRKENDCAIVLLCYEHSQKFCHRHLVSKWLIEHGFVVKEFAILPKFKRTLGLRNYDNHSLF